MDESTVVWLAVGKVHMMAACLVFHLAAYLDENSVALRADPLVVRSVVHLGER